MTGEQKLTFDYKNVTQYVNKAVKRLDTARESCAASSSQWWREFCNEDEIERLEAENAELRAERDALQAKLDVLQPGMRSARIIRESESAT